MKQQFISKRNHVYLSEKNGEKIVVKEFVKVKDWKQEVDRYAIFKKEGIRIPEVIEAENCSLLLSFVEGKTMVDILEEQETAQCVDYEPWKALVDWLIDCANRAQFWIKDLNLRNFIYQEQRKIIYGIDFEGEITTDFMQGAAVLIAYLQLYRPERTSLKYKISDYLISEFCEKMGFAKDLLYQEVENSCVQILEYRKKRH